MLALKQLNISMIYLILILLKKEIFFLNLKTTKNHKKNYKNFKKLLQQLQINLVILQMKQGCVLFKFFQNILLKLNLLILKVIPTFKLILHHDR